MKTDKKISHLPLTRKQAFFAASWFNMAHRNSLDSYRVQSMNPYNILRELSRVYEHHGKAEDRSIVRNEACSLIREDPILSGEPFRHASRQLVEILDEPGELAKNKEEGAPRIALKYFIAELDHLLKQNYIESALNRLETLLVSPDAADTENADFAEIRKISRNLLSTLIDGGASIESLFALHTQVIVPRKPLQSYSFERKFSLLKGLILEPKRPIELAFSLDNISDPNNFPREIGGIKFSVLPPFSVEDTDRTPRGESARKYLTTGSRRVFAALSIESSDPRQAGASGLKRLNDILNLVRFEYETERISSPDAFALIDRKKGGYARVLPVPNVVPNPSSPMDAKALAEFVESVDGLAAGGRFEQEGRDRIYSAFRLYRTGSDTTAMENKLVNWWTAIEYLVRGANGEGTIGKSVENMLAPVLCSAYLAKHLDAHRDALLELGVVLHDPAIEGPVTLRALSRSQFYRLLCREDMQGVLLSSVKEHPFFESQLSWFIKKVGTPNGVRAFNAAHEQRLRWHLQRIWRARCDIVHSSEQIVSANLLCANLEYYLKTTLKAILKAIRKTPTLSGPKEFFDRQTRDYAHVQLGLKNNDSTLLLLSLDS